MRSRGLVLTTDHRTELETRERSRRGRGATGAGETYTSITAKTGCSSRTVALWKRRFETDGTDAGSAGAYSRLDAPDAAARGDALVDAVAGAQTRCATHHRRQSLAGGWAAGTSPRALQALDGP